MAAAPPTPLAAAIRDLRKKHGSHEKLAVALGTTRQTVMRWEKGAYPRDYAAELVKLGIPKKLLEHPEPPPAVNTVAMMQEALENQRQQKQDLEALAAAVEQLAADMTIALGILEELRGQGPPPAKQRPRSR